jgi:hypothetical protein
MNVAGILIAAEVSAPAKRDFKAAFRTFFRFFPAICFSLIFQMP